MKKDWRSGDKDVVFMITPPIFFRDDLSITPTIRGQPTGTNRCPSHGHAPDRWKVKAAFVRHRGRTVPLQERGDSESVAEVMKPGTATIRDASQTDLARQFDEGPTDYTIGQWSPSFGEKKARGRVKIKGISFGGVMFQLMGGGGMQGDQTGLPELGKTNGENALVQIHIVLLEGDGFADS